MEHYDVIVIGAGAAGMMAAIEAGKRGRKVLVFDHAKAPGEKIRISGGGRCNFTNVWATVKDGRERFLSENPRFAFSALARYTPENFIDLVKSYGIAYHEKTMGQLFCDESALQIVDMLLAEMRKAGVTLRLSTTLETVEQHPLGYRLALSSGEVTCTSLIVAAGGKSIPKMGATNLAYRIAEQFGLRVTATRAGLVPLTFEPGMQNKLGALTGISTDVIVLAANRVGFYEAMLFTHRGLSGPAILQVSNYWKESENIYVDFFPTKKLRDILRGARSDSPKLQLQTVLSLHIPRRLAQMLTEELRLTGMIGDFSDATLARIEEHLKRWAVKPVGSEGYRTAEVTLGGVSTADLESNTLEARKVPGLFFVGECVDVTGWLGGYNFQWAWSSGWAAGQVA